MKLLICVTFHYRQERLQYLRQILQMHQHLAPEVHVIVNTNVDAPELLASIMDIAPPATARFHVEIESFTDLPNPWLLTWTHKVSFARRMSDPSYTHYMYSEDDMEVTPTNIAYWLRTREALRPFGLYPSFMLVEWSARVDDWVCVGQYAPLDIDVAPTVRATAGDFNYLNLLNPYQGIFFYDKELMLEHVASPSFDIMKYGNLDALNATWGGGVAERANFALTFENVPNGFTARNVVPYFRKYLQVDLHCIVHHLPNTYANRRPDEPNHASIRLREFLRTGSGTRAPGA